MTLGAQLGRPASQPVVTVQAVGLVVVDSASPRASLGRFFAYTRHGDFAQAAAYLDFPAGTDTARYDDLARRLSAVLDSRLWLDLENVSPSAEGAREDGLPSDRELLGTIVMSDKREVAIRMARVGRGNTREWKFSELTVNQVDNLYADLPDHWIR